MHVYLLVSALVPPTLECKLREARGRLCLSHGCTLSRGTVLGIEEVLSNIWGLLCVEVLNTGLGIQYVLVVVVIITACGPRDHIGHHGHT